MKQANISYTKNHLSEIIAMVREGETVLVLDRNRPVARLEAVGLTPDDPSGWRARMETAGVIRASRPGLDPEALLAMPMPAAAGGGDIVEALRADREEGR